MQYIKFLKRLCALIIVLSCIFLALAFYFQPKVSDDYQLMWQAKDAGGMINYWLSEYETWTGRVPLIVLSSMVLTDPILENIYRLLIVGELVTLVLLAWYCARGKFGLTDSAKLMQLILFGELLWLALPGRAQTVVWLNGNFAYLVPAILGLGFIAWSKRIASSVDNKTGSGFRVYVNSMAGFLIGFFAGSSQEQIVAACSMFLALQLYTNFVNKKLFSFQKCYWAGLMGFLCGIIFMVSAPGNYARMSVLEAPSLFQILGRMGLFVPGAFFELGVDGVGKSIWTGVLLLAILYIGKAGGSFERIKRFLGWLLISLASLFVMFPATNFISIRVTFFAVLFLYIAVASMFDDAVDEAQPWKPVLALLGISTLVLVEAISGLIANYSISNEMQRRIQIVNSSQGDTVLVPFISTQPSVLSYIDTPEHDRDSLVALGNHFGKTVVHDTSQGSPFPNSLNPMKSIKFAIGKTK